MISSQTLKPSRERLRFASIIRKIDFLLAIVFGLIMRFVPQSFISANPGILIALTFIVSINIWLAVFNLIPIPPLDGSRVLMGLLPANLSRQYAALERYGFIILFVFIWLGIFERILWPVVGLVIRMMG